MVLALLLAGCQSVGVPAGYTRYYRLPPGAVVVLKQPITIPANKVKVYIQNGRVRSSADQYRPFCRFEVYTLQTWPRVVQPDEFLVYRSGQYRDVVSNDKRRWLAARSWLWLHNDLTSPMIFGNQLYLRSAAQPDVYRMLCGHLQETDAYRRPRNLTIDQIRYALGDLITLRLPR